MRRSAGHFHGAVYFSSASAPSSPGAEHVQSLLEILAWIEGKPMWLGLAALALGAGIEYVFPPFPATR